MKAGPWAPKDTGNTMNERQATKGNRDVRDYSADNRSMEPVLCPELRLAGHLQKSRRRTREMTASCLCRVLFLITWILLLASVQASAQMDEYDIKAGYLYNFSRYVRGRTAPLPHQLHRLSSALSARTLLETGLTRQLLAKWQGVAGLWKFGV